LDLCFSGCTFYGTKRKEEILSHSHLYSKATAAAKKISAPFSLLVLQGKGTAAVFFRQDGMQAKGPIHANFNIHETKMELSVQQTRSWQVAMKSCTMCIVTIFFRQDGDHEAHGELAGRQGHHLKTDISGLAVAIHTSRPLQLEEPVAIPRTTRDHSSHHLGT
jgi:hypothetical protein